MAKHYFSAMSIVKVSEAFKETYPNVRASNKTMINVIRFQETGSVHDNKRSGRPSVPNSDKIEEIKSKMLQSLHKS